MFDVHSDSDRVEGANAEPRSIWALVLIAMTQLMVVLDGTVANIALPYIRVDLDISQSSLTWVIGGYALVFGSLLLLGGRLGDIHGYRRVLAGGLVVFAGGSLLGGVATSEGVLLLARGLQAVGAALAAPAALALIPTTFPEGSARDRAFALYAATSGAGAGIGLILGGWLTGTQGVLGLELSGWRLTFLVNVPIALAAAALAPRVLVESRRRPGRLDLPGALSGTIGLVAVVFGLTRAGERGAGWGDAATILSLVAGAVLIVAFVVVESTSAHPLLPLRILADRARAASLTAMVLVLAAMFAMFYFLTLFLQQVLGFSAIRAGLGFLPLSIGIIVGAGLAARWMVLVGERTVTGWGTLVSALSLFMLSRLTVADDPATAVSAVVRGTTVGGSINYWTQIFPYLSAMAIGIGLTFAGLTRAALDRIPIDDAGIGSGVLNTAQQIGGAVGLALLSTVALATQSAREESAGRIIGASLPPGDRRFEDALFQATFTVGATRALLVAAALMLLASALVWLVIPAGAANGRRGGPSRTA